MALSIKPYFVALDRHMWCSVMGIQIIRYSKHIRTEFIHFVSTLKDELRSWLCNYTRPFHAQSWCALYNNPVIVANHIWTSFSCDFVIPYSWPHHPKSTEANTKPNTTIVSLLLAKFRTNSLHGHRDSLSSVLSWQFYLETLWNVASRPHFYLYLAHNNTSSTTISAWLHQQFYSNHCRHCRIIIIMPVPSFKLF